MRRLLRAATVSLVLGSAAVVCSAKGHPVTDEASALRVAEKAMIRTYGRKQINSERPLTVTLSGDVWIVHGSLPLGWDGGVAEVKIDKRDGRILSVIHGK
jgi:hypothetical protein